MKLRLPVLAVLAVLATALVALAPVPARAAGESCRGLPATVVGTSGVVAGTPGDDVIVVSGSVTEVDPGAGSDTICLQGAAATVHAGADDTGDDVVDTTGNLELPAYVELGGGHNTYVGGSGPDTVLLGHTPDAPSTDVVDTGAGPDVVTQVGAVAALALDTGSGADVLTLTSLPTAGTVDLGGGGNRLDVVLSGAHQPPVGVDVPQDRVEVGEQELRVAGIRNVMVSAHKAGVFGDGKDNEILVNSCSTGISGGRGDDVIRLLGNSPLGSQQCLSGIRSRQYGGAGDDTLTGGRGPDLLVGGPGRDRAFGLKGIDHCSAELERSCERPTRTT